MFENLGQVFRGLLGKGGPHAALSQQQEMQEALDQMVARKKAERALKSKKGKKDYGEVQAREILERLQTLPADHPLRGIQFTPAGIAQNPALAGILTELTSESFKNIPETEASYTLLLKKLRDVTFVRQEMSGSPFAGEDERSLGVLAFNLEKRINIIATHVLLDKRDRDIQTDIQDAQDIPEERGVPLHVQKEAEDFPKPRANVIPLDFTGHYSPLDPNVPTHLRPILEQFHNEVRQINEDRNFPNRYIDTRDSTTPDDRYRPDPDHPDRTRMLKNYEVALRDLREELTNAVVQYGEPDKFHGLERVTIQDIFPYLQQITRYERTMSEKRDPGQVNPYRQLGSNDENALRRAAENQNLMQRTAVYESIFYKLLKRVLQDPSREWTKSFGLYETEAVNEFFDLISEFEGGHTEVARLINKMYAIFSGHDAIVIAMNPAGDEEAWQALSTFARNSYTLDTLEDPIAHQLVNIYERVLWDILKTYDGRIPPELVEPTAKGEFAGDSKWDQMVIARFFQMVDSGVVFDAQKDPKDGKVRRDKKNQVLWDRTTPVRRSQFEGDGRWRLIAAMQQAKGFGLLNARLLEVFALQRTPAGVAEEQPNWIDGDRVFSSIPYEGMARFINPIHLFTKWKVADDKFRAYWNIIINDGEEGESHEWWAHDEPKRVFDSIIDGTFEEKYPEKAERFLDKYTWGMFSGGFGPWSTWRVNDSIIGMTDKQKEFLGGSIRLSSFNEKWATEDVKEFLVEEKFKKKFMYELFSSKKLKFRKDGRPREGNIMLGGQPVDMDWLEKEWRAVGKNQDPTSGLYTVDVLKEWNELKHHKEVEEFARELKDVYNVMTWVQMAQRSPQIVARNVEIYEDYHGKLRKRTLRDKILEEMFPGLNLEQDFHKGGGYTTDNEAWLNQISILEGDIDTVAHMALYDEHGPRNITESDFEKIVAYRSGGIQTVRDEAETILRKERAKEYFRRSKKAILGNWTQDQWFQALGVHYSDGGEGQRLIVDYHQLWDHKRHQPIKHDGMSHIQQVLEQAKHAAEADITSAPYFSFDEKLLHRKHRYLLSTEDVVWDKLELINLGYRQWARRGGDFVGHATGLKAEMAYITNGLRVDGDFKTMFEHFHEISDAYALDDKYWSEKKLFLHAQATAKFFKQDWWASKSGLIGKLIALGKNTSIAQEVSSRQAGAAWDGNKLYEFAHQMGAENLLPWKHLEYIYDWHMAASVHQLEVEIGGTKYHAIYEALSLGLMMAYLLMAYSALIAPDEEEKAGGGGGSHHD